MIQFYASEPRPPERPSWKCRLFDHQWHKSHIRGDRGEPGMDTCLRCYAQRANYTLPCRCLSVWVPGGRNPPRYMPGYSAGYFKGGCQCESNGFAVGV